MHGRYRIRPDKSLVTFTALKFNKCKFDRTQAQVAVIYPKERGRAYTLGFSRVVVYCFIIYNPVSKLRLIDKAYQQDMLSFCAGISCSSKTSGWYK